MADPLESGGTVIAYIEDDQVNHARESLPADASPVELPSDGYTALESPTHEPNFKQNFQDLA